jgi:hypothetical protein
MCNLEHTTRPSSMMWPCMHTKGKACRRKSLFTSPEWPPSNAAKHSHHTVTAVEVGSGVWRTVSRFQIPLGLSASLTSRVPRQREWFCAGSPPTWTQERQIEQSQTAQLPASFLTLVDDGIQCVPRSLQLGRRARPWILVESGLGLGKRLHAVAQSRAAIS